LRDEFEEEAEAVFEVEAIKAFHDDAERHLNDGEDNCKLHLEVVCVGEQLVGDEPLVVEAKGVYAIYAFSRIPEGAGCPVSIQGVVRYSKYLNFVFVAGVSEELHWNSEELVIDEAIKHGEKAHQQKKIPH